MLTLPGWENSLPLSTKPSVQRPNRRDKASCVRQVTLRSSGGTRSCLPDYWKLCKSRETLGKYIDHKKNMVNKRKKTILKVFSAHTRIWSYVQSNIVLHGLRPRGRGEIAVIPR